jgi:small neutral amino acid transporter SnatA (MarC family)
MKNFELSFGESFILFFLTLGPLEAILPFARVTRGTDLAFQQTIAWRSTAIATVIAVAVALLVPPVLTNWHVSSLAVSITAGIILFSEALRIVMQAPPVPRARAIRSRWTPRPVMSDFVASFVRREGRPDRSLSVF